MERGSSSWTQIAADAAVQVRNYAMLLLLAVYGFRAGEVCALTLDDIDWEHERIHPPRPKQRKVGQYPLVGEVADAVVRYLRQVRPRCASRAVFVTLRRPYRPPHRRRSFDAGARRVAAPRPDTPAIWPARASSRQRHVPARRGLYAERDRRSPGSHDGPLDGDLRESTVKVVTGTRISAPC